MAKHLLLGLLFICLFNIAAHAQTPTRKASVPEPAKIGFGALIGGLLGGPPGAIVGAAGGAWLATHNADKEKKIEDLQKRLSAKEADFAALREQFAKAESNQTRELQQVALQRRKSMVEQLTRGVSLTVYFRTDSADLDADIVPGIQRLAGFVSSFPEIQLRLDAFADRRGSTAYNLDLSRQRAESVRQALIRAGIPAARIHEQAHGETGAQAVEGDREGYVFDRRVNIHLSLDTEV